MIHKDLTFVILHLKGTGCPSNSNQTTLQECQWMPKETTGMATLILISQKISKNTVKIVKHTQYICGTLIESLRLNTVGAFKKKRQIYGH